MANCNGCNDHPTTSGHCVQCDIDQMARNHYFTGKLLVERDFTDEQHYHMGKARRHNKYLHGWGVVCGLKVKQHPNEECRHQYVVVEPGVAIDCCGREIFVRREEFVDVRAMYLDWWRAVHGESAEPDEKPRDLQLTLCYAECPSEEVPALFDDCGCDDEGTQPNRILESYRFGLRVGPSDPLDKTSGSHRPAEVMVAERPADMLSERPVEMLSGRPVAVIESVDSEEIVRLKEQIEELRAQLADERDPEKRAEIESAIADLEAKLKEVEENGGDGGDGDEKPTPERPDDLGFGLEALRECVRDVMESMLDGCPDCEQDDDGCLVLAEIQGYVFDQPMVDRPEEGEEVPAGSAIINNSARRPLPSTTNIMEIIQCLFRYIKTLEDTVGITGIELNMVDCDTPPSVDYVDDPAGEGTIARLTIPSDCGEEEPPPAGTPGIDRVVIELVDCEEEPSGEIIIDDATGERVLVLRIPSDCKDEDGPPPAEELTRICAINWRHGGAAPLDRFNKDGLLVAFTGPIRAEDIHPHSVRLLVGKPQDDDFGTTCWCEIQPEVLNAVFFEEECNTNSNFEIIKPDADEPEAKANGLQYRPNGDFRPGLAYRILINGDFIRDSEARAVDADHLPPWLPAAKSGDGVAGGTFESWFTPQRLVDVNRDNADVIATLPGITPRVARSIVATRREALFASPDSLTRVTGIGPRTVKRIRELITT